MKSIGIEIDKKRTIIYSIEKNPDGSFLNITGEFKSISINDPYNNDEIREYQATLYSFFDNINPDRIGILKRQTKGQFAASPLSFKLEGIIQCYLSKEIEFISPATLRAFLKNNELPFEIDHKYQINAANLSYYLLEG